MRIGIICIGRLKAGPETELVQRYKSRFNDQGRGLGFSPLDMVELPESRARRPDDRKQEECVTLLAALEQKSVRIVLDERGKALTTEHFARLLNGWRDNGQNLSCVIGGADGLSESIRASADLVLSFGALTIPHQIVRVLLIEQLYRVTTLLSNHPYHRGDG